MLVSSTAAHSAGKFPYRMCEHIQVFGITNLSWSTHINQICSKAKKLLGYFYRHFHDANASCLITPILGYGACIWDLYQVTYTDKLERVQHFVAKVITQKWSTLGSELVQQLGLTLLKLRRLYYKLRLCKRILHGNSFIPASTFTPHPSSSIRH